MRPAHVYANVSDEQYHQLIDALHHHEQYHQLIDALHHQWRVATRAVMILLSVSGMTAAQIGDLLHYHPRTVRRWIDRHDLEGLAGLPEN